jgi:hypothetical protein
LAAGVIILPQYAFSHETLTTTVLFDREIVRILDKHCVMCHFEKGPAFPLETWDQTWLHARKIRSEAIARHMPPWSAFPGYGEFANDNGLTLRETQFLVSWVEGSGPRNAGTVFTNVADPNAPRRKEVRAQADFSQWQLGTPDLKVEIPPHPVEPQPAAPVERAVIDLGLTAERRIRGLEYMPGDRRVVAAAFFTIAETGQWVGSWTPWYGFLSLPKGTAWRLPAGAHIAAEIHYRGAAERAVDRGTIGLYFADPAAADLISDLVLEAKGAAPRGGAPQKVRAATRLAANTYAVALRPQAGPGVQSIEVSARKPDGTTEVMLFVKNIRLDWPTPYVFREPVLLPKGSELAVTTYYANAAASQSIRLTVSAYAKGGGRAATR